MKRKYLSALLMGVLTLSSVSTFTSCKDYDDDISNLQEQIDKLATADQLSQKVAELQALISSNKSDITSLQSELGKKTTLDEVKAVLADYATKEYVDGADATLKAAIDALETGKVAELEAAVKAAQAAADKAAADAEKANAEIVETLKKLATKAEVEEVQNAANTAIAAVESKNAEALEEAQAAILETLKGYATTQNLKEVADAADKALKAAKDEQAAKDEDAKKALSDAVAALNTAIGNAQTKANTAAADASKALADLVTTTKTANDAKKLADENKQSIADALKLLGEGYSAENTVAAAIKAIQAQVGTPNKELGTLDTRLAAIESVLNGVKDDDTKLGLATKVTNIENKLKEIIGEYTTMVTEVSLVGSFVNHGDFNSNVTTDGISLDYKWGKIYQDFTFGKAEKDDQGRTVEAANQQTFVAGTTFSNKQEIVVRVNPTNAVLTKAAIKLVDSQGNSLDDVLEIGEPKQFTKLLTKAANTTGLWTIPVTVKNGVDKGAIEKKNPADSKHILYAVAVQNTKNAEDRYVASTYDITVPAATAFTPATNDELKAGVKIWSVNTMANETPVTLDLAKETISSTSTTATKVVPAKSGEDIKISFKGLENKVKYFYVVRDDSHVDKETSGSSAINAWNSYKYGGTAYGKIVEVNPSDPTGTINVTINGQVGDEIGFRIFAVNYDGTLTPKEVAPTATTAGAGGNGFVVYVGENQNQATVNGDLVAKKEDENSTGWLPLTGKLKDAVNGVKLCATSTTHEFTADNGIKFKVDYSTDGVHSAAVDTKNSDIKFVKFTTVLGAGKHMSDWKDGSKANFTISQKDADNKMVENEIVVSLTKKIPTAADAKTYTWKDNQLVNGVYTAYVTPSSGWTTADATEGYQILTQAINDLNEDGSQTIGYHITIDGVEKNATTNKWEAKDFTSNDGWKVTVPKELINGTTEHKTTISYNYGKVSSDHKNADGNYVVTLETVQTVFACPLTKKDQSYDWAQYVAGKDSKGNNIMADLNYLTYGSENTVCLKAATSTTPAVYANLLDYIIGTNKYYNNEFGGSLNTLRFGGNAKYAGLKVELISAGSGKEDYFHAEVATAVDGDPYSVGTKYIKFTQKSQTSNPAADVKSYLVIKLTDAFGCDQTYKLPFTVKRAQ